MFAPPDATTRSWRAPWASLVAGAHGVFYGTTADGGTYGAGTVFALQRPATAGGAWKTSLLYNFGAPGDGVTPYGSLVIDAHGELYGTTWEGGAYDYGTVFQLRQPATPGGAWTETVLYTFTGQSDGANPWGLSMSAKGDLYGATVDAFGGYAGTIYELAPTAGAGGAWTHSVLHAFTGGTDGCYPFFAPVAAEDGTVYGTTYGTVIIIEYFGVYGDGTVFKLEQSAAGGWQKTVLHNFASAPWGPDSPLLIRDGAIYGTAGDRISLQGGQVFELQPPVAGDIPPDGDWSIRVLHQFDTGVVPYGTIAMDANGVIFGTTGGVETVSPLVGTAYRLEP